MKLVPIRYEVVADTMTYFVEDVGDHKWAIRVNGMRFNKKAKIFEYEPSPSNRTQEYKNKCSFDSPEKALTALKKWYNIKDPL